MRPSLMDSQARHCCPSLVRTVLDRDSADCRGFAITPSACTLVQVALAGLVVAGWSISLAAFESAFDSLAQRLVWRLAPPLAPSTMEALVGDVVGLAYGSAAAASQVVPFRPPPRPVDPRRDGRAGRSGGPSHQHRGRAHPGIAATDVRRCRPRCNTWQRRRPSASSAVTADPSAPAWQAASLNAIVASAPGRYRRCRTSPSRASRAAGCPELFVAAGGANLADAAAKVAAAAPASGAALVGAQTRASAQRRRRAWVARASSAVCRCPGLGDGGACVQAGGAVWWESGLAGAPACRGVRRR